MPEAMGPLLKRLLSTILVPGFVTLYVPYILLGRTYRPDHGLLAWLGVGCFIAGAIIYFRCAWEFAVRGLGTPAPIAPTKFLVVSGLHRYLRNPMYIGVLLVILPWTPEWTDNYLLLSFPALRSVVSNGFFRGICSGLGLLDIWIGFWEALHYHEQQ